MDALKSYLKSLGSTEEQEAFAARCGTSLSYIRKVLSLSDKPKPRGKRFGESLAIKFELESGGAVSCQDIRPDVDWPHLRGSRCRPDRSTTRNFARAVR